MKGHRLPPVRPPTYAPPSFPSLLSSPFTIVFPVVVAGVDPIVAVVVVGRFACRRRGLAEVLRMR